MIETPKYILFGLIAIIAPAYVLHLTSDTARLSQGMTQGPRILNC